jgi:hypothetical protein
MFISSKNFSVAIFLYVATSLKAERQASLHPCRNVPSWGYPGHDALLLFFRLFKKHPDIYVVTDRTSERFFGGRLDLARSKDDGLCGAKRCYLFKVPSNYASTAMVRRLAGTT